MRGKAAAAAAAPVRFAVVTLDSHLAGAFDAARARLARELPGLELSLHVQAEWEADPAAAERARVAIGEAHFIACAQLFTEEQAAPVLDAVRARRDAADAVCCAMCAPELTRLTRLGRFDMARGAEAGPWSPLGLLQKLRGSRTEGRSSGERQMAMLRRLPALLKFVPGPAQDVRAYFLTLQYWLGGTAENLANLVRFHVRRYAAGERAGYRDLAPRPSRWSTPRSACGTRRCRGSGSAEDAGALPRPRGASATVGLLVGRSYLLAANTRTTPRWCGRSRRAGSACGRCSRAHSTPGPRSRATRAWRRRARAGGARRPKATGWTRSSTSPASRSSAGPRTTTRRPPAPALAALDVPYLSLQTLEFQSVAEWRADARGLNPLQATLQVAIPELDGAVAPAVYGGAAPAPRAAGGGERAVAERVEAVADRVAAMVRLRRTPRAERKLAVVLFNFPPNAGNTGSAAYLNVFPSLQRTLARSPSRGTRSSCPRASTRCGRWCATATASASARRPTCTRG
jgi:magnesium chelatase subunit H